MRRWTHGHSTGAGMILALALSGHLLWFVTAAFAAGLAVGLGWASLRRGLARVGRLERERWLEVRARRRHHLERSRGLRDQVDRRAREAYWRGVGDGSRS